MSYTKQAIINEIVCLFKEYYAQPSTPNFNRLVKWNKIFLDLFNCEFLKQNSFYLDHNTNKFVTVDLK